MNEVCVRLSVCTRMVGGGGDGGIIATLLKDGTAQEQALTPDT